eukprot:scaffold12928_cov65-Phaeocystis_antarctica.AAC.1
MSCSAAQAGIRLRSHTAAAPPAEAVPLDLCNEQRAPRRGYAYRPSAGSLACAASPSSVDVSCACGHQSEAWPAEGGHTLGSSCARWDERGAGFASRARSAYFRLPTAASRYSRAHGSCTRSPPAVPTSATRPFAPIELDATPRRDILL